MLLSLSLISVEYRDQIVLMAVIILHILAGRYLSYFC